MKFLGTRRCSCAAASAVASAAFLACLFCKDLPGLAVAALFVATATLSTRWVLASPRSNGRFAVAFALILVAALGMQMELADDGIGIAREDQQKVFDRFYRVDSSRTKAQGGVSGTGLGLSIASWIAEQHGIEISMESELGQGTKMILRIPLVHRKIRQNNE